MKKLAFTILFIVSLILCESASAQKKEKLLEFHIFGPYYPVYNPCRDSLQASYGFKEVMKGRYETKKSLKHNAKVEDKLTKRNGMIWRRNYERALNTCLNKNEKK